jgi:hypothetical protein
MRKAWRYERNFLLAVKAEINLLHVNRRKSKNVMRTPFELLEVKEMSTLLIKVKCKDSVLN